MAVTTLLTGDNNLEEVNRLINKNILGGEVAEAAQSVCYTAPSFPEFIDEQAEIMYRSVGSYIRVDTPEETWYMENTPLNKRLLQMYAQLVEPTPVHEN